jgi:nuclease-like protein
MARLMRLRYAGVCESCQTRLPAGTTAWYDPGRKKVRCQDCSETRIGPPPVSRGTAGASAAREYERLAERHHRKVRAQIAADLRWREQVKRDHPVLGRFAAAITVKPTAGPEPQYVAAWKAGADGERRVGVHLDGWAEATGGIVLHDRRIPPTRANVDHIALNSEGVWVIDAKEYKGMVNFSGGILSRAELRVDGRVKTHLAEGVWWQMERVAAVLDEASAGHSRPSVCGVLCFVGAEWPLLGGTFTVNGVTVAWPAATVKMLTPKGGQNDAAELQRWARILAKALPPA